MDKPLISERVGMCLLTGNGGKSRVHRSTGSFSELSGLGRSQKAIRLMAVQGCVFGEGQLISRQLDIASLWKGNIRRGMRTSAAMVGPCRRFGIRLRFAKVLIGIKRNAALRIAKLRRLRRNGHNQQGKNDHQ
ncbi:MAG: hypothetical protein V1721_09545 [Pseudomonadota bacterium]